MTPSGSVSNVVDHVDITFDSPIDPASLSATDIDLRGAAGSIPVVVSPLGGNVYRLAFPSLPPGEYALKVGPDVLDLAANRMNQDGDTTNGEPGQDVFAGTISVRLPDLLVHAISVPAEALVGQPLAITWAVTNRGNATARAPWTDHLSLANRATGSPDIHLASVVSTNDLPPGQALVRTQIVIVPSGIAGARVVVVHADQANAVPEGPNEGNNALDDDQPLLVRAPDLQVSAINGPATALRGQSIDVTWTVRNAGNGPANAGWSDGIYLGTSTNGIGDATPLLVVPVPDAVPLAAGANYTRTRTVTLPLGTGLAPGDYFLLIAADASGTQPESNRDNNLGARALRITPAPLPDLAVRDIVAPPNAVPGVPLELRWTVTNRGNLAAIGAWSETVAPAGHLPLATLRLTNHLAPGVALVRTQIVTLSDSGPSGSLHFEVEVDRDREVIESDETNNLTRAVSPTVVPARLTVRVGAPSTAEDSEGGVQVSVTRNGDPSTPLTVALASSDTSELTVPASVTIPSGQVTALLAAMPRTDGIVDGPQTVTLSATAPGYAFGSATLEVLDVDRPSLNVSISEPTVVEAAAVTATVTRDVVTAGPVVVHLASSDDSQITVPDSVTIPGGQASAAFNVRTVNDTLIEAPETYTVSATAPGFRDGTRSLEVRDDDIPTLVVQLAASEVSEGAGPRATTLTVTRDAVGPRALVVALESSNEAAARLPSRMTIPAGELAASVSVATVDNTVVDGPRTSVLRAFPTATSNGVRLGVPVSATLRVLDDDGPTLRIQLDRERVAEGLPAAAIATVSRNSNTSTALTVNLASSDPSEATVPATVVLASGQATATFPVSSVADGTPDGDHPVTFTASAAGFTAGTTVLVVTDRDLPDLVVTSVVGPADGTTEERVPVTFRVTNQGLAPTTGTTVQRVFLSPDPVIGDDTLVGQAELSASVPAGSHFEQTLSVRLPRTPGNFWLVVTTDSGESIPEALEGNNAGISARPIRVGKTYGANVSTDVETAPAGTPIPLRGQATLTAGGGPAAFVPVNIHLEVRGTRRVISTTTDASGRFATVFQPLPGEAGNYGVGADHPGVAETPVQDRFTLVGLRLTSSGLIRITEGSPAVGVVRVENLSDVAVSSLAASVISPPPGLTVGLELTNTLAGLREAVLVATFAATDPTPRQHVVKLRVTGSGGVSADVEIPVALELLRPRLAAEPGSLLVGMKRGEQTVASFRLANRGGAASGDLDILPPALGWLSVASGARVPSLAPGAETLVTLLLAPPPDLPLGDHEGALVVAGAAAGTSIPFRFRALSTATGDLKITATDEYTYYAEGSPNVTNATVTVTDVTSGSVVAGGSTDTRGELLLTGLPESHYRVEVRADGHAGFRSTLLLRAGQTNDVLAFMNRETVKYIWKVVPTEVEDRTTIVIETVFETVVPFPVVTIEPMLIDLNEIPGGEGQIDLKITNHGLVAANHTRLEFESHPLYSATPLIRDIGTLAAKSSVTVPLLIKRLPAGGLALASASTHSSRAGTGAAPCNLNGRGLFDAICGPVKRDYSIPLALTGAGGCSLGSGALVPGGNGFGGLFGGGGGTGFEGGGATGGPAYSPPIHVDDKTPCNLCPLQALGAGLGCAKKFLASDISKCLTGMKDCFSGDPRSSKTAYKCFKTFYSCAKAAGAVVPGAGWVSNLKYLECANDMLHACSGASPALASLSRRPAAGAVAQPELEHLRAGIERLQTVVDLDTYLFGSTAWFQDGDGGTVAWLEAFLAATDDPSPDGPKVSTAERADLLARPRPVGVSAADAAAFVDRWNRSLDYWNAGIVEIGQVPAGQSTDFIAFDQARRRIDAAAAAADASGEAGYASPADELEGARQELVRFYQQDSGGDCATVRLRLEQQAVITRDAFDATLEIVNSTGGPLENVSVELAVKNQNGGSTTDLFGIRPPTLSGLGAVDGTGTIAADSTGKASWILIPTSEAAPEGPTVMLVSGTLRYRQSGTLITVPLAPVAITVLPNASLRVKYFHQRDVFADDPFTDEIEPSIPYSLGVLIQNRGRGAARNVRITSAQPRIIENSKGLLIDFEILATEVAGQNQTPSLTATFGNVDPGSVAVGRWLLRSSLQGLFIDYQATFEHLDGLGDPRLSLIDGVEIHEMNHVVEAGGPFADGRLDFLANDVPDLEDLPDTLHLSDGRIEPVALAPPATVDAAPAPGRLEVRLAASMPSGWGYLRTPDPGDGRLRLVRVRRADGTEVPPDLGFWTTDRTFIGNSQRPLRQNLLHLLDYNGRGTYTLFYEALPDADTRPPTSAVATLPTASFPKIPVRWSGDDGEGSGIASFDVFISTDDGPFVPWLQKTPLAGALYEGAPGRRYAFYSVATDNAGNREPNPSTPDAQTVVSQANTAPRLSLPENLSIDEQRMLSVVAVGTDSDLPENVLTYSLDPGAPAGVVIDPATGALTWATGEGNGPSTHRIVVRVTDNGTPPLSATAAVKVTVREVNQAPDLVVPAGRALNEGTRLTFTATASDADLPANRVRFSLGTGAPSGASISPDGVFTWTPSALQGPSTNVISIVATDDGTPPLATTGTVTVVVRDVLGDFTLGIGRTNLLAGQAGFVPLRLSSGIDLTRIVAVLETPGSALPNLGLQPLVPEIDLASLHPLGPGRYELQLRAAPGEILQGDRPVARITFDSGTDSAVVPLRLSQVTGDRESGLPLTRATTVDGRVIVIGSRPILDAVPGPMPSLLLYGMPGRRFGIDVTSALGPDAVWTRLTQIAQTRIDESIVGLPIPNPPVFYRAIDLGAGRASLAIRPPTDPSTGPALMLNGEVGRTYEIESIPAGAAPSTWRPRLRVTPRTPVLEIPLPVGSSPDAEIFRLRDVTPSAPE